VLVDKLKGKKQPAKNQLSDEQEADADLATAIGRNVIANPDMQQAMSQLVKSADPVMALGQFVSQLVMNVKEKAQQSDMPIDDMVWMASGGVVERLIEESAILAETFGVDVPKAAEAAIYEEVMNVLKMASKAGSQPQQPGAPQGQPQPTQGGPQLLQAQPPVEGGMY
jgi:hypothetical protein